MSSLKALRKAVKNKDLATIDYALHPAPGNTVILDLVEHPHIFWNVFGGLSLANFEALMPDLLYFLERLHMPVEFWVRQLKKCNPGPSLYILQWICVELAMRIAPEQGPKVKAFLKKRQINKSAADLFASGLRSRGLVQHSPERRARTSPRRR